MTKIVQKTTQSQVLLECSLAKFSGQYQFCPGLVIPIDGLDVKSSTAFISSLSKVDDKGKAFVSAIITSDKKITLYNRTQNAQFEILYEAQPYKFNKGDPRLIPIAKNCNHDDSKSELNQLTQDFLFQKIDTTTGRPPTDYSKH